jgi:hypothetical protein
VYYIINTLVLLPVQVFNMRLTSKKIVGIILALAVSYVAVGVGLLAVGAINRLYFWPGWSLKGPKTRSDLSGFAADGPVVFYHHGKLVSKRIVPKGGKLVLLTDTLTPGPNNRVQCFVGETEQTFEVRLRSEKPLVPADTYPAAEKLLAVSDIEGNFKGFQALLRGAGVIDAQLRWCFGRGHLVLVGDFFDRGLNVTECLWLVYKLEQEAEQAGGKVHFIMGNHERMNLTGHFKYVRRKYFSNADTLGVAYPRWYDRATVIGQWLRTKNVAEKIGSTVFVHGGLSPQIAAAKLSLRQLNDLARSSIGTATTSLTPQARLATQPPGSPDWYRGLVLEEPREAQVEAVLKAYGATTMVVGHTPVERISRLYHGKVVAIDLPHQQRTDAGEPLQALWLENGVMSIIDSRAIKSVL